MASSKSLISTALAGLALCVASSAQSGSGPVQAVQAQKFEGGITRVRATQEVDANGNVTWDYTVLGRKNAAQGGGTPSATPGQRKALVNCFNNTITNGFFSVGTTGTEWMSWAVKNAGKTDIVGAFAFAYASNARGLSEPGGTGATIGVSFFSGSTGFCARGTRVDVPGDADDVFSFAGLPGATGSQVSPGFSVTATLDTNAVFCLPDGKIGWTYVFQEPLIGTNMNLTGPLLTDLSANTCWSDAFDLWSSPTPVASCAGVFFFGGCTPPTTFFVPNPCSSFWIQIFEETVAASASFQFNDTNGFNPVRYAEVQGANVGENWLTSITLDPLNPAGAEVAAVQRVGLPGVIFPNGPNLSFFVNNSRIIVIGTAVNQTVAGPGNPKIASVPIPKDTNLIGATFNTQAFGLLLSPVRFQALNGVSFTIGAQ